MLGFVSESEYGIPKRCPCGGRIIGEVRRKDDYDTLPGKRFFTCKNYEADGFHYCQPWVIGVHEEIERLTKRVEEAEQVMLGTSNLSKLIDRLEVRKCRSQVGVKVLEETEVIPTSLQGDSLVPLLSNSHLHLHKRRQ
ncbi:hypothetical protein Bca52824_088024 [Brassica carinata]|uniref:Zinc finger GRF-type domain-containing protein n=1 Tax=Brassica carinata TaxID=52824 RepID=A0A8X7PAQ7_BRACI|nr:hypothetical protein Bca52824_088024 [Brassica carinata]